MKKILLITLIGLCSCNNEPKQIKTFEENKSEVDKLFENRSNPSMIAIESVSVKLSPSGQYKYVFNVRNFSSQSNFKGRILISLITKQEASHTQREFELDIAKQTNTTLEIEAHTGTPKVHGEAGNYKFGYIITADNGAKREDFGNLKY